MTNEVLGGIQRVAKKPAVSSAAAITLARDSYINQVLTLTGTTGQAITLPAANGSGTAYSIVLGATVASGSTTIKVANSTDIIGGVATMGSSGGTSLSTGTAATSDTITFNGTTSAGIIGTKVNIVDIASGIWQVEVQGVGSGIQVTPFSATV